MSRPKKTSLWTHALSAREVEAKAARVEIRKKLLQRWKSDPAAWLFGKDPTTTQGPDGSHWPHGVPLIWTTDERDPKSPIKPLPDKPYLRALVEEIQQNQFVLIEKCRQMMASWTILLLMDWEGRTMPSRRMLLSKTTEDEGCEMLTDKVEAIQERLPPWVQAAWPQVHSPRNRVYYPGTRSYLRAVQENAAIRACRGGTASLIFVDEGAFQEKFDDIIAASLPMAAKLVACTTPNLGNPGAEAYKQYLLEGLNERA